MPAIIFIALIIALIIGSFFILIFLPIFLGLILDPLNKYLIRRYFAKKGMRVNDVKIWPSHYSVYFADNNGMPRKAKCCVVFGKIKWKDSIPE